MATAAPEILVPVILVGNKSDIADRKVSIQEGHVLAKELGCGFVEASAKNYVNVEKAFYDVVRRLRRTDTVSGGNGNRLVDSQTKGLDRRCAILEGFWRCVSVR
jgi:Fe2+ transport system protein B